MAVAEAPEMTESDRQAVEDVNRMPDKDPATEDPQSVEAMAEGFEDEDGQQSLLDFGDSLTLTIRGKKPTRSLIKIRAISREVKGQIGDTGDDEEVFVLVRCRPDEVAIKTHRKDDGKITGKDRRHQFEPVGVVRLPDEVAEGLFDQFS